MAREKSSAFEGASQYDVDVDALTHTRVIQSIIGDVALVHDRISGQNAHGADVITHDGTAGRGSLLGVPNNQWIGANLSCAGAAAGAAKNGDTGTTWIIAKPYWIAGGETEVVVELHTQGTPRRIEPVAYFKSSTTYADVGDVRVPMERVDVAGTVLRCTIRGLTSALRLFFIEVQTDELIGQDWFVDSLTITPQRQRAAGQNAPPPRRATNDYGVTIPSATQGVAHVDFDASWFADSAALDGYLLAFANRNINGLEECMRGWPCGGNLDYVHVDHDGAGAADDVDPARSRFMAHTRSLWAAEPELEWQIISEGYGAFLVNGYMVVDHTPTVGMLEWFAPYITDQVATTIRKVQAAMPDFQTGSSRLKWAILCGSNATNVNAATWTAAANAGGADGSLAVAAVSGSPTNPGGGNALQLATGSALAFTADSVVQIAISLDRSAGVFTAGENVLLGFCLYFDP